MRGDAMSSVTALCCEGSGMSSVNTRLVPTRLCICGLRAIVATTPIYPCRAGAGRGEGRDGVGRRIHGDGPGNRVEFLLFFVVIFR